MMVATAGRGVEWVRGARILALLLAGAVCAAAPAQNAAAPGPTPDTAAVPNADGTVVGDSDATAAVTPVERERQAWRLLTDAMADAKHPQDRIQGLAALGMMRSARSAKMITDAMADADVDVRTAAALAAGQTKDRNLTTPLRNLLDDKEPQVAFTAALTLYKMGDMSGEDILLAVVDGERSAGPTLLNGTRHKINSDLHNPGMLARLGAMQGASMLLGPFGFGITAFEFVRQSGGDLARAAAIEQIAHDRTEPIHAALIAALADKDVVVRAAAAKALVVYHDKQTSNAVYALLTDAKQPVRLTGAAAYLRTTGTPGPSPQKAATDADASTHPGKRRIAPTPASGGH